jgi:DNA-binding transcriptional MerR regulator
MIGEALCLSNHARYNLDMYKIGDFSKLAQVSTRTLRYYDELDLLKPHLIDHETGYRLYTADQLPRLNRILVLKDLGFDLQQIADLLDVNVSAPQLRDYLVLQERDLAQRIYADQERLKRVREQIEHIEHENEAVILDVVLKSSPSLIIAGNRMIVATKDDIAFFARHMYAELYTWLRQHRIAYTTTQLVLYHNDEYVERDYDMEVAVVLPTMPEVMPLAPHGALRVFQLAEAPLMATTIHRGRLRDADQTSYDLIRWSTQRGYHFLTEQMPLREIHYFEQSDAGVPIPAEGIMELQLPILKPNSSTP